MREMRQWALALVAGKTGAAGLTVLCMALASLAGGRAGQRLAGEPRGPSLNLNRDEALTRTFRAELRGGVVSAGCGMRATGPPEAEGTITIAGIPPGSTVVKAILNWTIMGGAIPDDIATIVPPTGPPIAVAGTFLGEDTSPCWPLPYIYAYTADVCEAMTGDGNGVYTIRIPDSGVVDVHPSVEGAALIVVYENPTSPARDIVIYEGLETQDGGYTSQTVTGFDAAATVSFAEATFVVSDGQGQPGDEAAGLAYINDIPVIYPYFDGDEGASCTSPTATYYDVDPIDVHWFVNPGATSLTAVVQSPSDEGLNDCLTWTAFVLSVATDTAPGIPLDCPRPCPAFAAAAAGPDTSICRGESTPLDASGSRGCAAGDYRYRWSGPSGIACDWSPSPSCGVTPLVTTEYTLEVSCRADFACVAADSVTILVDANQLPPSLGNSLRAVRVDSNVLMTWRTEPLARSYSLYRGESRGVWPGAPHHNLLDYAADVDIDAVPSPPGMPLYYYKIVGATCSGAEGP